jgi:hypothetical protein
VAVTETYVDPAIASNSGTGTIGDPYGDLQYALDTLTRDATNGDRINIKAGTDEVLAAALSLTTYGTPTQAAPLIIQGYTSAAGDGGIGGISGAATYGMFAVATLDFITLIDLHMHNSGTADIVALDDNIVVIRCHVNNTTGSGVNVDIQSKVLGCYVHDCGSAAGKSLIDVGDRSAAIGNWILNDDGSSNTISLGVGAFSVAAHNIIKVTSASTSTSAAAINTSTSDGALIYGNSIYANGRASIGISAAGGGSSYEHVVINNIVEGFSGVGGVGIRVVGYAAIGNAAYNNTTNYDLSGINGLSENNDTLSGSAFVDATNNDFDINGSVTGATEDAWPQSWPELSTNTTPKPDKGAVQAGAGAGSSGGMGGIFGSIIK